jgi:hypothetical protein
MHTPHLARLATLAALAMLTACGGAALEDEQPELDPQDQPHGRLIDSPGHRQSVYVPPAVLCAARPPACL